MTLVLKRGADKKTIREIVDKLFSAQKKNKMDIRKYCGTLRLKEDPMEIQKKLRDEWE